jgi:outer membrane protein assembly factor BamA
VGQAIGSWRFFQGTLDYRRYDKVAGPVVLASRLYYFGRRGRDANLFVFYGGNTELVRGFTYGSYVRNECSTSSSDPTQACPVNNLIGSQVAVGNLELRVPLLTGALRNLPIPLPGLQTAVWYDIGLVWDDNSIIKWNRQAGDSYIDLVDYGLGTTHEVRTPVRAWGLSLRANVLGFLPMRLDYAIPIKRPGVSHLWTLSLGPMF